MSVRSILPHVPGKRVVMLACVAAVGSTLTFTAAPVSASNREAVTATTPAIAFGNAGFVSTDGDPFPEPGHWVLAALGVVLIVASRFGHRRR